VRIFYQSRRKMALLIYEYSSARSQCISVAYREPNSLPKIKESYTAGDRLGPCSGEWRRCSCSKLQLWPSATSSKTNTGRIRWIPTVPVATAITTTRTSKTRLERLVYNGDCDGWRLIRSIYCGQGELEYRFLAIVTLLTYCSVMSSH
jgi:hypothetical protein